MAYPRTNKAWHISEKLFKKVLKNSLTLKDAMREMAISEAGNVYSAISKRAKELGIDLSHFKRYGWGGPKQIPLKDILVKDFKGSRTHVKNRLIKDGLLKNICAVCGQDTIWNGIKLVLVLDHKNGNKYDYRLKNLRLICPNCNSQTDTFSGRNLKRKILGFSSVD